MFKPGLFCDKIGIMKNKVSFLATLAILIGANCAHASECVGDDCDFQPIIVEQNIAPMDFVEFDEPLTPIVVDTQPIMAEYETCDYVAEEEPCVYDYNCPFATAEECAIWYKKPAFKTNLHPRAPHFSDVRIDDMLYAIYSNYDIPANAPEMSPLLDRYLILMKASHACCSEGIMYKMRQNGASDKAIYEFLKDDANYYAIASRCMVMNDDEFENSYSNGVTKKMAIDVRNACLCKNRQWFESLLQPYFDVYDRAPMFEERPFAYSYIDDMQRPVTVYINDEVHNTIGLIGVCPR